MGHEGFSRFWKDFRDPWKVFRVEITETREVGDHIMLVLRFVGTGRDSGVEVTLDFAHMVRVADGRIKSITAFGSVEDALRSVGGAG